MKVVGLEPRMLGTPPIDVGKVLDSAGQKAASKRRIGDEANSERAGGLARFLRLRAIEDGILGLNRRDRVDRVGAADAVGPCFRETQKPDLALLDQASHGADRLL